MKTRRIAKDTERDCGSRYPAATVTAFAGILGCRISRYAKRFIARYATRTRPQYPSHPPVFCPIRRVSYHGMQVGALARYLGGLLVGGMCLMPMRGTADLIRVGNLSGDVDVGSSSMFLRHAEGGSLDHDSGDAYWYLVGSPPGMSENDDWLRIYSDQVNRVRERDDREMETDNRPFSGEDTNQPFPLILDTRYKENEPSPAPISSSNNLIRFELQSPIDEGREYYHWTMSLDTNVASFVNSTNATKSGTWDLDATGGQGGTYDLPLYNLTNAQGQYATLDVLPSADSGETHTLTVISEHGGTTIGNPTGAGTYAHGHSATSSVDRVHAVAPGSRLRAIVPPRVEDD